MGQSHNPSETLPLFRNAKQAREFVAAAQETPLFSSLRGPQFLAALALCAGEAEMKERLL